MDAEAREWQVSIELLGHFRVHVGESPAVDEWPGRRPAELVQLLVLAPGRRLTRDEVIEALWPHLDVTAGAANLRKAAHHARQALGSNDAVVLRGGQVALFPSHRVETDVEEFEVHARQALGTDDAEACAEAAAAYRGELLPEARYEDWAQAPRERLHSTYVQLLRQCGQWERVVAADPTDEPAHRELMRRELAAGRRAGAIRCYGRLRDSLRREVGMPPSRETQAIYDECVAGLRLDHNAFVGRQFDLARARALLRAGASEAADELVVRGPPGIGKSAFCHELGQMAREEGWLSVTVAATAAAAPYAPFAAAAEQLVAHDSTLLNTLGEHGRSVLRRLRSDSTPERGRPLTRHQVIGAVRRLLLGAGGGRPVMFVLDDVHLADEATIDALHHLGSAAGSPLLVVLAYRPEAAPEALVRGVARLARAGRATEIDLEPLDRRESAALVAAGSPSPRPREVVDRIIELAQGNPFLTLELARSAVAGVPALVATTRDAITSRLVDLDEDTAALLRRLALAGDALDPTEALALSGAPETETFAVLDAALTAGILVVSGHHYRFRHELVRQALIEQLPPHQRIAAHRDTARSLVAAGAAPGRVARHWLAGRRPGEASEWLLAAAKQSIRLGAYADALGHLAPLLDHEPGHPEALRLRAEALDARGSPGAPAAYAAAAGAAGERGTHDLRAKQALAQIKLGDPPGGLRMLEGVEPTTLDGRLAQALALAGSAALGYGDPGLGTAKAAEARRLALQSGDPDAVAVASWAQAAAAHARGELRHSVRADLRETNALPKLAVSVFDGQLCITQRLLYGARPYHDVIAFADSFAAEAKRLGAIRGLAFAVTLRGEAEMLAGDLDSADADLLAAAELHREVAAAAGEAFALQRQAEVALYRGEQARALTLVDDALDIARESNVGFHLLDRIYGTRVRAAPEPTAGLAALEEAEEAVRGPVETCPGCRITLAVPAAIAAARARDVQRLKKWEKAAEWLSTVVMRLPAWNAALDEIRGHHAQLDGDDLAARHHFHSAAVGFGAAGQPLDQARCATLAADGNH